MRLPLIWFRSGLTELRRLHSAAARGFNAPFSKVFVYPKLSPVHDKDFFQLLRGKRATTATVGGDTSLDTLREDNAPAYIGEALCEVMRFLSADLFQILRVFRAGSRFSSSRVSCTTRTRTHGLRRLRGEP